MEKKGSEYEKGKICRHQFYSFNGDYFPLCE